MFNVYVDYNSKINYTTGLNGIYLIRNIRVENDSDKYFENLYIEIILPTEVSDKKYVRKFNISKESYYNVSLSEEIKIDLTYLLSIVETGQYKFEVNIINGHELIFEAEYDFEILPYNHWLGMSVHPDLIASFISPNDKHVTKIISEAAKIARDNNFSMAGYQSGLQKNVRKQINAIFESIKRLDINYISLPPSFEENGQKIRSIDEIVDHKLANCLDIAVLAASCLEAISLNPFIIIVKGHAFVGAWLEDKTYPDSIIEDRSFFLKRLAKGVREVELFESVLLTSNDTYTYQGAIGEAEDKMEIADNFIMGIDIKQARSMMIKPLPKTRDLIKEQQITPSEVSDTSVYIDDVDYQKDDILLIDKSARDKMQTWESKLLDLTLRNNLLNFIPRNRNISLVENDLGILEDKLSTGAEFSILAAPDFIETENKKEKIFSYTRRARENYLEFMNNEIRNNRLVSLHSEAELDRSLRVLYRESRSSIQENGSNALFLAVGFLKWFETDLSEVPRFSPIILYPIEIVRKGGGSGYKIRYSDEEVQINTTLLEKIRNDLEIEIPGLNPIPQDDNGIDVSYILNTMRAAVKDKDRWDVVEWSYLGIFSFSQFVMWEDIRRRTDEILENKNVKRVLGHNREEMEVIEKEDNRPLFLMPADSSQAMAVTQSLKGEDFVLHGPPGTGKSQTITNIIASSLYNGKTVLFVAEKMAALEVVQDRLNSIGLSDFSLELHSNKSKKTEVLQKLGKTLEIKKRGEIVGFEKELEKYDLTRKEAKELLLLVNSKQENGMTLYQMMNIYAQTLEEDDVDLPEEVFMTFSEETMNEILTQTTEIKEQAKLLSKIKNHSFSSVKVSILKMREKETLITLIHECSNLLKEIINKSNALKEKDYILGNLEENTTILKLLEKTISDEVYFKSYLKSIDTESIDTLFLDIKSLENDRVNKLNEIKNKLSESVLNENIELIEHEWQSSQLKWFLPKILKQNSILKVLNLHAGNGKISKDEVSLVIDRIKDYNKIVSKMNEVIKVNGHLFVEAKKGNDFDYDRFEKIYDNSRGYKDLSKDLISYNKKITYEKFINDFVDNRQDYKSKKGIIIDIVQLMDGLKVKLEEFDEISDSNMFIEDSDNWLETIDNTFFEMKISIDELDLWLNYNRSKEKLISNGYLEIIKMYEENNGDYNLYETIIKNLSYSHLINLIDKDEVLYGFSGTSSNLLLQEINTLKNTVNKILEIDLYERLANELPDNKFNANPNSEIGYLKKAIGNGGRGISLRELFSKAPNALRKVAPCMLMSPISVAQYISPDNPKFDLIIFDEASQVETHRAIGAISRGTQVIVVGDPKQLPPTSFFKSNVEDESFEESDLPSILDELISLSFPGYYLKWHYRSNHESLITFSNQTYYDDGLYTFPSVNSKVKKVSNINVEGTFGVPKSGQNIKESEAILSYLKNLLVDKKDLSRSIGVVTFNQPQRSLILDMIDEEMKKSKEFSTAIESLNEEFFVKNIENVQGDERDLIIFSIGFGPKEDGRMSMNFGPINQKGGSKRLNVAVTRARDEMILFSSFSASKIDLNRTSKEGPRDLKIFLEYAQSDLTMQSEYSDFNKSKNSMLIQLKKELKKRGYSSEINLGSSEFKIDLAIEDNDNPNEYIAAVMLDGGFEEEDSLDDRVSTQKIMLERLGWKTINIWSVDWFKNKNLAIETIINNIEREEDDDKSEKGKPILEFSQMESDYYYEYKSVLTDDYLCGINYVTVDEFYENSRLKEKASIILKDVVDVESPILFDTLCRRVMLKFDLGMLTDKMRRHFLSIITMSEVHLDNDDTVWSSVEEMSEFNSFRIPGEKRDFLDIPKSEVRNAILFILKNQLSLTEEEIHREVFKVFGYNMLGEKARKQLSSVVIDMNLKTIYNENGQYNIIE